MQFFMQLSSAGPDPNGPNPALSTTSGHRVSRVGPDTSPRLSKLFFEGPIYYRRAHKRCRDPEAPSFPDRLGLGLGLYKYCFCEATKTTILIDAFKIKIHRARSSRQVHQGSPYLPRITPRVLRHLDSFRMSSTD